MKEVENKYYWEYPFGFLTFANYRKYPNQHSDHVISVDVVDRKIDTKGFIITDRIFQLKQPVPLVLRSLGIALPETTFFLERSVLDPTSQEYTATSYNLTMRQFFEATESCKLTAKNGGTVYQQKASFTAFSYFSKMIEEVAVSRFEANAAKGRDGLRSVLDSLELELKTIGMAPVKMHAESRMSLEKPLKPF